MFWNYPAFIEISPVRFILILCCNVANIHNFIIVQKELHVYLAYGEHQSIPINEFTPTSAYQNIT